MTHADLLPPKWQRARDGGAQPLNLKPEIEEDGNHMRITVLERLERTIGHPVPLFRRAPSKLEGLERKCHVVHPRRFQHRPRGNGDIASGLPHALRRDIKYWMRERR
jgi:hypothetical protein